MIRALRGDNIEEIMEEVVKGESAPGFRDLSYTEFYDAFHNCAGRVPNRILAEPDTFRFLIQKFMSWLTNAQLRNVAGRKFELTFFNGARFCVAPDNWKRGRIWFYRNSSQMLGSLDMLDRTSEGSPESVLDDAVSTYIRWSADEDDRVPF